MKILISGGSGMVGRNLSSLALTDGYDVLTPLRNDLDLLDYAQTISYLKANKPDVVVHAAGLIGGIQANIESPYQFCYQNLQIGMNIIQASFEAGIDKLINLGSSCMYPRGAPNPLKETQILTGSPEPTNEGFAVAKIAVSRLVEYLAKEKNADYKTYVPCNLYGYWDSFDEQRSHMIPAGIRKIDFALRNGLEKVEIWGSGEARREFMFAEDLADFILFSLDVYDRVPININVGTGKDYTINEYYQTIADVLCYEGLFEHDLDKPSGMEKKLLDVSLQKNLGWSPATELKAGVEKTYKFYLDEILKCCP